MSSESSGEFHRIRRLPPYVFAEVNSAKAKARTAGEDIIDLGMGNPDSPTPRHIVEKLIETVQDPRSHRYSVSAGIPGLRRALATYYRRRFDVELNPETEVVATLGSKEGLANLASAITSPGDTILVPNPSYPIHQFGFIIAGAGVRSIPATPDDEMLSALDRAVRHSVPKPTALIVNFPSNPTAHMADLDFYREIVAFARRHEIWVMSDLAYAEIYFNDKPPPSILQVPGAKDIAVEFTSLSKTYSMPGWRMGFAAGNPRLINALTRMKSYLDYGAFTPIQVAAVAALTGPQECVAEMRALYKDRRDVLINVNFPDCRPEEVKGISVVALGRRRQERLHIDERKDGRGNPYYWIAYTRQNAFKFEQGTDIAALEDNCVALTPLRIDITDEPTMTGLAKLFAKGV